jgi:hypothetical protein
MFSAEQDCVGSAFAFLERGRSVMRLFFVTLLTLTTLSMVQAGSHQQEENRESREETVSAGLFKTCVFRYKDFLGAKYYEASNPNCTIACIQAKTRCVDAHIIGCKKLSCD